jgi:AhpD family alkylhydroperoxidase
MAPRIALLSDERIVLGLPDASGLSPEIDDLRRAKAESARSGHLDPVTAELVRLRNAVHQGCNLCQGLRSKAALDHGATEDLLSVSLAGGDAAPGDDRLDPTQRAALRVADAFLRDPTTLRDPDARADVLGVLTPDQVVEVVTRLGEWSYNKVLIGLGFDLDDIRPQVY